MQVLSTPRTLIRRPRARAMMRGISFFLLAILAVGLLPSVQAAAVCDTNPITDTAGDERSPQLNANYIVWYGFDGSDNEIYLYNLTTQATTPITNNAGSDVFPQISDTHVVWQGNSDGDNEVFLYEIATGGTTPLTENEDIDDRDPQVFGNYVVYRSSDGSDSIINMYNITTEETDTLSDVADSTDNRDPQTNGSYVTWNGLDTEAPNDREVFIYNIGTQTTTQVTDNSTNDIYPYLSENYLSFRGTDGDFEIYYYLLSGSGPFPVTDNTTSDDDPRISGHYIVWHGNDGNDEEVLLYNILTTQTTPLTNNSALDFEAQIRGNSVVYRSNVDGDSEIYLYDIATAQYSGPFSDNAVIDTDTQVYGQTVVWSSQEDGDFDIHLRACGVELLVNGGFETDNNTDNIPDNWSIVARSSDRMRCNGVKTVSYAGECAFHFKGSVGENAKLKQLPNLSGVTIEAGDTLAYSAYIKSGDTKTKAKLKLIVTYADSTTETRSITINKTTGYQLFTDELAMTNTVTKVVFMLHNRGVRGNLYIDNASLLLIRGEDALVPLPPAAPLRQSS